MYLVPCLTLSVLTIVTGATMNVPYFYVKKMIHFRAPDVLKIGICIRNLAHN